MTQTQSVLIQAEARLRQARELTLPAANEVFETIRNMNRTNGTTFLLATRNMELARRCDRNVEVIDGRIAAQPAAA